MRDAVRNKERWKRRAVRLPNILVLTLCRRARAARSVLGSWGKTTRDAVRNKERWNNIAVRLPKILVLIIHGGRRAGKPHEELRDEVVALRHLAERHLACRDKKSARGTKMSDTWPGQKTKRGVGFQPPHVPQENSKLW